MTNKNNIHMSIYLFQFHSKQLLSTILHANARLCIPFFNYIFSMYIGVPFTWHKYVSIRWPCKAKQQKNTSRSQATTKCPHSMALAAARSYCRGGGRSDDNFFILGVNGGLRYSQGECLGEILYLAYHMLKKVKFVQVFFIVMNSPQKKIRLS